jgi:antitoxin component of MazEF toxin-antitoxin module
MLTKIKKWINNQGITLRDRLEMFYNQPIEEVLSKKPETPEEIDWGKPVGKEIW